MSDNKYRLWELYEGESLRWGRVLELGPLDGRDTVRLARHCDELTCIEGRPENVHATRGAAYKGGIVNVDVIPANLEEFDLSQLGTFDVVWAVGILYHMPRPWELMAQILRVAPRCMGWSHVAAAEEMRDGNYAGCRVWEHGIDDTLSGLSPSSFWLTRDSFVAAWDSAGAQSFVWLTPPEPHENGGLAGQFEVRR